jgi:lipopolysaccharide biosynthesis glycosyltransferase
MNQIFTSFNEKYRVLAAVCIASIFEHTGDDFEIVVLDTGIRESTKKKFERWAIRKKRSLTFIKVKDEHYKSLLPEDFELPADIEYYPKLLAPHFAAKDAKKILYLDADIICLKNPKEIYDIDLGMNIICAVQDIFLKFFSEGIINYKDFNFQGDEPYFNTGLLLIDVNLWKSQHLTRDILLTTSKNQRSVTFCDQYAFNIVLYQKWKKIPVFWNEHHLAEKSITIFRHYVGIKPLEYNCLCNDKNLFFKYLTKGPYSYFIWKKVNIRLYIAKLKRKLNFYSNNIFKTSFDTSRLDI